MTNGTQLIDAGPNAQNSQAAIALIAVEVQQESNKVEGTLAKNSASASKTAIVQEFGAAVSGCVAGTAVAIGTLGDALGNAGLAGESALTGLKNDSVNKEIDDNITSTKSDIEEAKTKLEASRNGEGFSLTGDFDRHNDPDLTHQNIQSDIDDLNGKLSAYKEKKSDQQDAIKNQSTTRQAILKMGTQTGISSTQQVKAGAEANQGRSQGTAQIQKSQENAVNTASNSIQSNAGSIVAGVKDVFGSQIATVRS